MTATFRIDDISLNTNPIKLAEITSLLKEKYVDCKIMLAVSPIVFDMSNAQGLDSERPFPKILNAQSDWTGFFKGQVSGVPSWLHNLEWQDFQLASHGLVHVDHRFLTLEAQEMSVLISCSIVGSKMFVPPFYKWDANTEQICAKHGLDLIKWEDGWNHLAYQRVSTSSSGLFYFHTHDFSLEELSRKLSE